VGLNVNHVIASVIGIGYREVKLYVNDVLVDSANDTMLGYPATVETYLFEKH
jgi:hypothetical protein